MRALPVTPPGAPLPAPTGAMVACRPSHPPFFKLLDNLLANNADPHRPQTLRTLSARNTADISTSVESLIQQAYQAISHHQVLFFHPRQAPLKLRPYAAIQICLLLLFYPDTQFPGNEKNYAMQYRKVQKSSWNEPYSSSSSFTKQSCSKMALYR